MGRKCNVPQCRSGYVSNPEKVSIFSTPKDDHRLAQWNEVISRQDRQLTKKDYVCEKHFKPDDIIREWSSATNIIPLQHPRLKTDAIPSIFSICPENKCRKKRQIRKNSTQRNKKARQTKLTSSIDLPKLISGSELDIVYIKGERDSPDLVLDSSIAESLEIVISNKTKENYNSNEDPLKILISKKSENDENLIKHNENRYFKPTASSDNLNPSVITSEAIQEPNAAVATLNLNLGEIASEKLKTPNELIIKKSESKISIDSVSCTSQSSSFTSLKISNPRDEQNEQPLEIINFTEDSISILEDNQNEQSLEIVNSKEGGKEPQKILRLSAKSDDTSNIFDIIWNGTLKPPNEFWSFVRIQNKEKYVSFGKFILSEKGLPVAERQVLVKKDLTTTYILNNNIVPLDILPGVIRSVDELEEILKSINSFKLCIGGPSIEKYPLDLFHKHSRKKYVDTFSNVWRHSECKLIIIPNEVKSKRCIFCKIIQKGLAIVNKRMQLKKNTDIKDSKRLNRNKTKCIGRLRTKVEKLKNLIKEMKHKLSEIDKISIAEKLDAINVPKTQQLLIMQCIAQSKLNSPSQMRFHKNWLQISLLIYQKNRGMYRFLQETGILPLPCRRTMHRYLNGTVVKTRED